MTDLNLGIFTAKLDPARCIYVTSEQLRIRHHHYHDVPLDDVPRSARRREMSRRAPRQIPAELRPHAAAVPASSPTRRSRSAGSSPALDEQIDDNTIVIADIGDALFAATELTIARADRVHQPGVLHVDGLLRSRGARRADRPARQRACW